MRMTGALSAVLVGAVVVASCAVVSEERSGRDADGTPLVFGACAEAEPDCQDKVVVGNPSAGEDPVAVPTDGGGLDGPHDATATVDPSVIAADSTLVKAGSLLSIRFPSEMLRGVHFVLESRHGDSWQVEYHLTSDWGDGSYEPQARKAGPDLEGFAIPDIGVGGPGPDVLLIPADVSPGEYRVCTGNARPNVCVLVTVD